MNNKVQRQDKSEQNSRPQESTPLISVVMPAYQAAAYIGQAVASVCAQTCGQPWELLVIDDCSTDHTADVMRACQSDPRIRYVRRRNNHGPASAR